MTVYPHERVDDLQRGGLKVIQNPGRFCFGMDAVLLSGFTSVKKGEQVMDLGTGTGIVPILLSAKTDAAHLTGLDIQMESVELARRSVELNGLGGRVTIDQGDLRLVNRQYKPACFDVVTANPPYMERGGGLQSDSGPQAVSRHELLCTLADVAAAASWLLRTGGRFYMVHRPRRLTDIITVTRECGLEPKTLRFVHQHVDKAPAMVLIMAVLGGKPMLTVMPPLIIRKEDGSYTEETFDIYYR